MNTEEMNLNSVNERFQELSILTKECEEKRHNYVRQKEKELNLFIQDWLGEEWGVAHLGNGSCELGLVEETDEEGHNTFYFGHKFSIAFYFNSFGINNDLFRMNYGSMGAFSLLSENDLRSRFLLGMGKFANDKERLMKLKDFLENWCKNFEAMTEELFSLDKELADLKIEKAY